MKRQGRHAAAERPWTKTHTDVVHNRGKPDIKITVGMQGSKIAHILSNSLGPEERKRVEDHFGKKTVVFH